MSNTIIKTFDGFNLIRVKGKSCSDCFFGYKKGTCKDPEANVSPFKGKFWCAKLVFGKLIHFIFKPAF